MAVQIVPSVLKTQVEEGMKLKPLAEHYGLPVAQMKKALKAQNLTIRKFHEPKFEFVEEITENSVEESLDLNLEGAVSDSVETEILTPQEQEEVVMETTEVPTEKTGW